MITIERRCFLQHLWTNEHSIPEDVLDKCFLEMTQEEHELWGYWDLYFAEWRAYHDFYYGEDEQDLFLSELTDEDRELLQFLDDALMKSAAWAAE